MTIKMVQWDYNHKQGVYYGKRQFLFSIRQVGHPS